MHHSNKFDSKNQSKITDTWSYKEIDHIMPSRLSIQKIPNFLIDEEKIDSHKIDVGVGNNSSHFYTTQDH